MFPIPWIVQGHLPLTLVRTGKPSSVSVPLTRLVGMGQDRVRAILHVDMDAFFVSVELLTRPELVGQEVIVGHPGDRSVVLSASYECRARGVKSAMPMSQAVRLAPRATVIGPTHGLYSKYSERISISCRRLVSLSKKEWCSKKYAGHKS